jgi:histidine triad (HIT) family protein
MQPVDCVFCKIASGQIPAKIVLDTPDCRAFLDASPLAPGHTLLIPKRHVESMLDAPPDLVASLCGQLPSLVRAITKSTGATGLNVLQNTGASSGQAVFHLHFHLIPRIAGDGLGYRWNAGTYQAGQAEAISSGIIAALKE